ncbi:MAG: hypothetical protein AAFR42_17245, partial [Cyanobacteria bacterium J06628_6]
MGNAVTLGLAAVRVGVRLVLLPDVVALLAAAAPLLGGRVVGADAVGLAAVADAPPLLAEPVAWVRGA